MGLLVMLGNIERANSKETNPSNYGIDFRYII